MHAILILSGAFSSCHATEIIWQEECDKHNIKLEIYDLSSETGKNFASELKLKSFPSFIVNNKVMAVGHPNIETAEKVIASLKNNEY